MSQFTNYGENKIADFIRGQGLASLPAAWHIAPLSAYSDSSQTEITGIGLARAAVTRGLANFSGTQGDGTTTASSGTSHTTSNNASVALGTSTGSATMVAVGFYDASSSGNCWAVWELEDPLVIANTDVVAMAISQVKFQLSPSGGMSDYLVNKLIDLIFRAQAFSMPATMYHGLMTATPSNAGGGTEVGGGVNYARASLATSLAAISGTQSAGSTTASSGTGGRISNNVAVTHPVPSGTWGTVQWGAWYDALTTGNLLFWRALTNPMTIGSGSPAPSFAANACGFTLA
jgi:hypothetical protein